jgi:hypothetical protein
MGLDAIRADIESTGEPRELAEAAALVWSILDSTDVIDVTSRLERYLIDLAEELERAAALARPPRATPSAALCTLAPAFQSSVSRRPQGSSSGRGDTGGSRAADGVSSGFRA